MSFNIKINVVGGHVDVVRVDGGEDIPDGNYEITGYESPENFRGLSVTHYAPTGLVTCGTSGHYVTAPARPPAPVPADDTRESAEAAGPDM